MKSFTLKLAAAAVAACGRDARVRGETLSLAQFAALSDALGSELGNDDS